MCKSILLFILAFCIVQPAFATIYTITVTQNSFTPSTFTAHPGDTVLWMWADGVHTTTSTTIPPGAIPWNNPLTADNVSFAYIPTVTGTYNYECANHTTIGMTGRFIIVSRDESSQASRKSFMSIYPNPAVNKMHIKFNLRHMSNTSQPVSVMMIDMNNKAWINKTYKVLHDRDIDVQDMPNGTYYLHARQGNQSYDQQIIIQH